MSDSGSDFDSTQEFDYEIPNCIDVSAGLVFRNGLLLITQRRTQDNLGGLWEFPGGKRESAESDEECLQRELREELGIEVEVRDLIENIRHDYHDKSVWLKFFQCVLKMGEPTPIACEAVAWVNPDQLLTYAFPAADQRLLGKLCTLPQLWIS